MVEDISNYGTPQLPYVDTCNLLLYDDTSILHADTSSSHADTKTLHTDTSTLYAGTSTLPAATSTLHVMLTYQHVMLKYHHILKIICIEQLRCSIHNGLWSVVRMFFSNR